ncbi:3729_t:CDS:2, partial [Dentiscutata erythropus]
HKKKQEIVASSSSQIIDELLNNANNLQDDNEEVISVGKLSQSVLTSPRQLSPVLESRIVSQLLSSPSRQQSPTQITFQITIPSRQLSSALESRVVSPKQLSLTLGMLLTSDSNFSNNTLGQFNPNRITALSPFNEMSIYQASADGSQFMSSNSMTLITAPNQDDKAKASRDYLKELKCLFLRGIKWLQIAKKHFGDFRNKLVNDIENLVKDFKKIRARPVSSPLQKEEIIAFVNEVKTLNSAFAVNYTLRDTEGTKALDRLTKSIAIPSRNGKNFANNIKL